MARVVGSRTVLAVRDLRTSTDYWMNVLGFRRDFGDESDGWSFLSRDSFRVMLGECPDVVPASELGDHSYVAYLLVEGIDEIYAELASRGAHVLSTPADKPWGLREFVIRTPDGHRITWGEPLSGRESA